MDVFKKFSSPINRSGPANYLDTPLFYFSKSDPWTIRDACEGTQIFGAVGSGKTSGSGEAIAKSFLRNGFGGLVLTAKDDERELWERYASETGREESVIIFSPDSGGSFNFLDYEFRRPGGGETENIVNLFNQMMEVAKREYGEGKGDPFWDRAVQDLLRNSIDLLSCAISRVTLMDIDNLVKSAPTSPEQARLSDWQDKSFCFECLKEGQISAKQGALPISESDWDLTRNYWTKDFPRLPSDTRGAIVATFSGMASAFMRGTLNKLFCTTTNTLPELTHEGAIIIVDLPVHRHGVLGKYSQVLFKYLWQQAAQRRTISESTIPIFLWADEAQFFVSSNDWVFQSTARSKRVATVYLTQNLPSYYAVMPSDRFKEETDSLLGNFQTKIFHANGDSTTNEWAANSIGKGPMWTESLNRGVQRPERGLFGWGGGKPTSVQDGQNWSQVIDYIVQPQEFTALRQGAPANNNMVDAFVFKGGKTWVSSGATYLRATFKQS